MSVSERKFGTLPTGEEVKIYHLENKKGAYVEVLQYGAILVKVCVPDKNGELKDVVLGYDDMESYEVNGCFFGAIIGRSGNRIENSPGKPFSPFGLMRKKSTLFLSWEISFTAQSFFSKPSGPLCRLL